MVVLQKMALARFVFLANVAPVKSAPTRQEPLRLALAKFTPRALTPRRLALERLLPVLSELGKVE
jgi:hypothetical protein